MTDRDEFISFTQLVPLLKLVSTAMHMRNLTPLMGLGGGGMGQPNISTTARVLNVSLLSETADDFHMSQG